MHLNILARQEFCQAKLPLYYRNIQWNNLLPMHCEMLRLICIKHTLTMSPVNEIQDYESEMMCAELTAQKLRSVRAQFAEMHDVKCSLCTHVYKAHLNHIAS